MTDTPIGTVENLVHYPVKGLSAQALASVDLRPNQGVPMDRAFGFARPGSGFDPDAPKPLPKTKFVVLARDAALALLDTRFDETTQELAINTPTKQAVFDLTTGEGRDAAAGFIAAHLGLPADMQPTLFRAEPHRFTDVSVVSPKLMNAVSLINLDSVARLSEKIGAPVDPARFRANLLFSGVPAFAELDWVDRVLTIGEVRLRVLLRTKRCPATQVNLSTGQRDLDIPALLRTHFGHSDMGIYCEVLRGGTLRPNDTLRVE